MKIDIKEVVHKVNENVPKEYRNIVWSLIILIILIIINQLIQWII